jgi:hypothetical protein
MKKLLTLFIVFVIVSFFITGCDTITNLPTNTTGGIFSLNGTWKLTSSTDNNAMTGTTIVVYPVVGNASVTAVGNNTYCVREGDAFWKNVKSNKAGGFTINTLVSACNGSTTYNDGTVSVVNNDKITVTSRTASNSELIQAWERVKANQ